MYTYICLSFRTKYNFQSHLLLTDGFIPANKEKGMVYLSSEFLFLIGYIFFFAASIHLFVSFKYFVCFYVIVFVLMSTSSVSCINYRSTSLWYLNIMFNCYINVTIKVPFFHEKMYLKIFKTVIIDHIFVLIKTHQNIWRVIFFHWLSVSDMFVNIFYWTDVVDKHR